MSQTTSATMGRRYGLERVCRLWEQSRSAFYARRARLQRPASADSPRRRGPTPALSDAHLLAAIRNDLARSPFQGEGHRKVHARLRILDGVRVSRTRVLRVMRAQGLLSPHRGRQGEPKPHDGTIVTSAPDVMWGTDGARVLTVDDGWVWTFAAVDHWNAECVGWHVCKVGSRFAALEPVAQGLRRRCGSVEADAGRGLALRMDHGSQYLSDHFLNQVRSMSRAATSFPMSTCTASLLAMNFKVSRRLYSRSSTLNSRCFDHGSRAICCACVSNSGPKLHFFSVLLNFSPCSGCTTTRQVCVATIPGNGPSRVPGAICNENLFL